MKIQVILLVLFALGKSIIPHSCEQCIRRCQEMNMKWVCYMQNDMGYGCSCADTYYSSVTCGPRECKQPWGVATKKFENFDVNLQVEE